MTAHPVTEPDALVRCSSCGAELRVSFAVCFREGWPLCSCNGETMSLLSALTLEQIDAACMTVLGPREEEDALLDAGLHRAAVELAEAAGIGPEKGELMASIDAEVHGLAVYLADAAVDMSAFGPRDEHFLTDLEAKANAIVSEVQGTVSRIRSLLPGVPDEIQNYAQGR